MSITILLLIVLGYMIFDILIEGYLKANNANRADMILSRMEELDGTNEVYEFLGQMEEDTNE